MENYVQPGKERAVLMLHGYTESAEKLREMAWYFIQAGFNVYSYDARGHGRSVRHVADESITHVKRFSDYVDDAEAILDQVILPDTKGMKLYLYGHSMGGAVSAHLLLRRSACFARAILTSPMIVPSAGSIPLPVATLMTDTLCLFGQGKKRAFIGKPFDAEREKFETSCASSRARFDYYLAKRAANRYLQNCSPTYGWTRQAVHQTRAIMNRKAAARVTIPVLLCQAEMDDIVFLPPQDKYIAQLPNGRLQRFAGKHELFNSHDEVMKPYVAAVIDFFTEA